MQCAKQNYVSVMADIVKCTLGTEGKDILHEEGKLQSKLKPTVTWIPWILLNGVSNRFTDKISTANS